jgi:hypothetical protein
MAAIRKKWHDQALVFPHKFTADFSGEDIRLRSLLKVYNPI